MVRYSVLRVFCGEGGTGGNLLAVFLTGAAVPESDRQEAAARIGFSETVFVDDVPAAELRIFTPATELPFAGHPLVGTAWLLEREREMVETLRPPAGEVTARVDGERAHITGRPEWGPPFEWTELGSPAEVDALTGAPDGNDLGAAWAWADEPAGVVRARVFPTRHGIAEDEATGSAAMLLAAQLGRDLEIRQGRGSTIWAAPRDGGTVEIGGHVALDAPGEL
jgi:predicted PhzF superfamily epimerase YddE/YHI9